VLAAIGIAAAAAAPLVVKPATTLLLGEAIILGLFALSLNLLVGTTGLVSFGHAAYFGFGAFTVGILVSRYEWPPLLALALAPVVGAIMAFVSGLIVLRGRELYFGLLTLGIAQLYWALAHGWTDVTGGENGLPGFFAPDWLFTAQELYWFAFVVCTACGVLLFVITRSPFGDALRAIRENRRRAEFTGIPVRRYELAAFVIAGTFAAVAGALFTMYEGVVSSSLMDWRNSAAPLIVSLIGGIGYFLGPVVGAVFYTALQEYVVARTVLWDVVIGVIVLIAALLLPSGISGGIERFVSWSLGLWNRFGRRGGGADQGPVAAKKERPAKVARLVAARSGPAPRSNGKPILAVDGLRRSFGGLIAVDDVSLAVEPGSIHAIIGPNGAGKTTFFNLVTGLLRPDFGHVNFEGNDVTGMAPWRLVGRGVGRSFQHATLFWSLSAFENVLVAEGSVRGLTRRPYGRYPAELRKSAEHHLERVGLSDAADVPANLLSHGDQRSLELAAALAVNSRLLLLDEPTAGLSPTETKGTVELIEAVVREQEITVLFIEHDMDVVFGIADQITVLHRGAVLAHGAPEEVRANDAVQRAYLAEDLEEQTSEA
jgi:ABC-type branched-subunit amino acid transport system ATPase component/ABC-type branched-subunit amino acid transport system permease subunit